MNTNTIYECNTRGPPGLGAVFANPQCFEMAFAETLPFGHTQNIFSSYNAPNLKLPASSANPAAPSPSLVALGIIPQFNDQACSNCLKTLAMTDNGINQCLRFEPTLKNGALIPVAAVNTPKCAQTTYQAVNRCAERCAQAR